MISRAKVHGKMLFQRTWNEGFQCSCLDVLIKSCCRRSARFAPPASVKQFLSLLKSCGKILQFAPAWNQDLSQKSCALSSTQRIQRRTNRLDASRPDGAPSTISQLSLSVKARRAKWSCSLFTRTSSTGCAPSGPKC